MTFGHPFVRARSEGTVRYLEGEFAEIKFELTGIRAGDTATGPIGTLFHEATHAFVAANFEMFEAWEDYWIGSETEESRPVRNANAYRALQESIALYVEQRIDAWVSAHHILSILADPTREVSEAQLEAVVEAFRYDPDSPLFSLGHVNMAFRGGQQNLSEPIPEDLRAVVNAEILDNSISDELLDDPVLMEMLEEVRRIHFDDSRAY